MILQWSKKYIKVSERLKVKNCKEPNFVRIYRDCLSIWNIDHKNIIRVKIDFLPIRNVDVKRRGSESNNHALLKHHAMNWLISNKCKDVVFEKDYPGGISDVCCKPKKIAIECGYLSSENKVITAVSNGWTVCWIPYQSLLSLKYGGAKESIYHILILNSKNGCKLDSLFRFATEKEIDKMYYDVLKSFSKIGKREERS